MLTPFNPSTRIRYVLDKPLDVTLKVYDILGQEMVALVDVNHQSREHSIIRDARGMPGGVYFIRLTAGSLAQTKEMILLK